MKRPDRIPVPLVTVDADAVHPSKVREAGSALTWLSSEGRDEDVTELVMDARNDLAERVHEALASPEGEVASVMTDIAVRHVISKLTGAQVLEMVQSHPELVLEARRHVETVERERG